MAVQYFELKYEFQDSKGWHACRGDDLGNGSNCWWKVPQALKMSYEDYITKLVNDFKPDYLHWSEKYNVLSFAWERQADMRKYRTWVNKAYRTANNL